MAIEVDNLFQALDIILDQRLQNMNYDKTDVCIITDDRDAKNGHYWVSPNNGETRYEAFSESEEYKKGESVRVSILNGDYTQKKFIVGKYVVDDAITPITYVSPLDTVIDVTGNMISEAKANAQYGLISNGTVSEIPIWSADLALDQSYKDLQASGIYNTISLSANFKTLLDNYDMRSGSFGLRLDVYVKLNPSSEKYIVRSVYMDSSEMFGNPYAFTLYSPQSRKYDLSQLGAVEKLSLWFYQRGDFSYYDSNQRQTINIDYKKIPRENILLRDIKIGFGSDLTIVQDNTIQAFTTNSSTYRLIVTKADNEKGLGFLWYNKDKDNQYLGYSDGIVDFEYENDEVVYTNKLDKNQNKVTQDVLDENKKAILEFAKDDDGNVILVSVLNNDGYEISFDDLNITIDDALTALKQEVSELKTQLQNQYDNKEIGLNEFLARNADINNYSQVKETYLRTDYTNTELEQAIETERNAELESLRIQYEAGTFGEGEEGAEKYSKEIAKVNALYNNKRIELRNYRVQKTYVLQKKQQDVMIQKVAPYDEFKYMEESETDARLTAQAGKEGVPSDAKSLKLSADLAEVKPLMTKTFDLVTKDLTAVLRQMRDRTNSIADITTALNALLLTPTKDAAGQIHGTERNNILAWYDFTDAMREEMYSVYTELLEYNYLHQENLKKLPAEQETDAILREKMGEHLQAWNKSDLYLNIQNSFKSSLIPMITNFFTNAQTTIDANYSGYQGIYDTYKTKADKIIVQINENLNKMWAIVEDNNAIMVDMRPYNNGRVYLDYNKKDLSNYDNRYAIYWYRYEPGYTSDDRLYPTEWKRLTTKADFGIDDSDEPVYNFGLPIYDDFILRDGQYYFSDKVQGTNVSAIRMMDGQRVNEKYKIVLFYNHEMYESNEVEFTNLDDVVDPTTADKNDAIVITHGTNSQDTYQSYGLSNFLVNAADASKVRELSVHYEGILAGDEALANTQVYWYIPNTATMLTCDDTHLTKSVESGGLGFFSDLNIPDEEKPDYSRSGYTCYYKTIGAETVEITDDPETEEVESGEKVTAKASDLTFTYKIKDYYLSTSSRNEIFCKVVKDEYTFETSIILAFTSLGTSGTDYTLAITPSTTQIATYASGYLPLNIVLYDYKNNTVPMTTNLLSTVEGGASNFKLGWEGPTSYAFATLSGTDDNIVGANIQLVTQPQDNNSLIYGILKATVDCPIEYTVNTEEDEQEDKENANKTASRNATLTSYYPIPYSAGNYYIEGATTIVYDSMGSNPSYYKDPYKIFTCNTNENLADKKIIRAGVESDKPKYDILWRIVYYKKDKDGKVVKLDKNIHADYNICRSYMPTLNEKNGLNASNMYMGNMDCWCAVECWLKDLETATYDTKYSLIWVQPIFILQNRYPSPMLNSWDGSLTIDKKNGTILSSLVGAGRKTRDNTFEGVLMGDIEGSAGIINAGNKSGLGIYGFNDGAQSFGFNVDGTGFIGKSGRGRILFDGNEGTIQSASYTADEEKPYGMKIDFDDGWLEMRGGLEYNNDDWANEVVSHYEEILAAKVFEVDPNTSALVETSKYVIDRNIMALEAQKALLEKIKYDAAHQANMYIEGRAIAKKAKDNGEITQEEYQKLFDELYAKEQEKKYYAMTTLKTASIGRGFSINDKDYKLTIEQYNAILNELDEYILAETYDGELKTDAEGRKFNYKSRYGTLSKALQEFETQGHKVLGDSEEASDVALTEVEVTNQSHIRLDVKSPYFYIISEQGKRILNIGDDTGFDFEDYPYLQYSIEKFQRDRDGTILLVNLTDETGSTIKIEDIDEAKELLNSECSILRSDAYNRFQTKKSITQKDYDNICLDIEDYRTKKLAYLNTWTEENAETFIDKTYEIEYIQKTGFIGTGTQKTNWLEPYGKNLSKGYYLKSNDFTYTAFSKEDGTASGQGSGFLLDLTNGYINAFNLSLASKNIFIDSSNGADPFLIVKDNDGCNLIYAGQTDFYLQSHTYSRYVLGDRLTDKDGKDYYYPGMKFRTYADGDDYNFLFDIRGNYQSVINISKDAFYLQTDNYLEREFNKDTGKTTKYGKGIKIDLQDGLIDAYDFIIRGESSSNATGGSYLLLDSATPQFTVHLNLPDSDGIIDLDLIHISPDDFVMHSANWLETTTQTTSQPTAKMKGGFNIRNGPGTNHSIIGYSSEGKRVPIYEGPTSGEGATNWYRIGEGQWIAGSALSDFKDGGTVNKTYGTGMEIDLNDGKIIAYNENNAGREFLINSLHSTYPIQLGDIGNYNFQIGWDGSLRGGSIYAWSIDASGTATFNRLNANGGSLSWMYIGNATITDATITTGTIAGISFDSGGLTAGNWTLSSAGLSNTTIGTLVIKTQWLISAMAGARDTITITVGGVNAYGKTTTSQDEVTVYIPEMSFTTKNRYYHSIAYYKRPIEYYGSDPGNDGGATQLDP